MAAKEDKLSALSVLNFENIQEHKSQASLRHAGFPLVNLNYQKGRAVPAVVMPSLNEIPIQAVPGIAAIAEVLGADGVTIIQAAVPAVPAVNELLRSPALVLGNLSNSFTAGTAA